MATENTPNKQIYFVCLCLHVLHEYICICLCRYICMYTDVYTVEPVPAISFGSTTTTIFSAGLLFMHVWRAAEALLTSLGRQPRNFFSHSFISFYSFSCVGFFTLCPPPFPKNNFSRSFTCVIERFISSLFRETFSKANLLDNEKFP